MPTFRAPRGTRDLLPPETATWTRVERLADDLASRYGYRRIETPLFEVTEVFARRGIRGLVAPPGAHRGDRPGLCPARHADLAAACPPRRARSDVPLRPPA